MDVIDTNRQVWRKMFRWIDSYNGNRIYPNETVVTWLLKHGRTEHHHQRVLDVGCGWCQSMPVFLDQGLSYYGVDVVDDAFPDISGLKPKDAGQSISLDVFVPPKLNFDDEFFSHVVSTEALHLNPTPETMKAIIAEIYRVLAPQGKFMATVLHPEYWFFKASRGNWIGENTIQISENHPETARHGAFYFLFKDVEEIQHYFSEFSNVTVGHEHQVFGEFPEKEIYHWIITAKK